MHAIIVQIAIHRRRETRRRQFAEIVPRARRVRAERDARNRVAVHSVVNRPTRLRAHSFLSVEQSHGLRFRDRVRAGPQVRERVEPAARGRRAEIHRCTEIVRAGQHHVHSINRCVRTVDQPVVVQILIHCTRERGRRQLAKCVAHACGARRECDGRHLVVRQRARWRTVRVDAIKEARWLCLRDRVSARPQIRVAHIAVRIRGQYRRHRVAAIVRAGQRHRRVLNPRFSSATLHAVVIQIPIHRRRETRRRQLAKIIPGARRVGAQRDVLNRVAVHSVVNRPTRLCADGFLSVEQAHGLRLRDRISTGAQVRERVEPAARCRRAQVHDPAEIVRAGQHNVHSVNRRVRSVDQPVVIQILIHRPAQLRRRQLAKCVAHACRARREGDGRHLVVRQRARGRSI